MSLTPDQEWWTAEEVAAAALPDLPATRQGVDAVIKRLDWRGNPALARRRAGKGGGWEYSWRLFPARAQRKLLAAIVVSDAPAKPERSEVWAWFDGLPGEIKAVAEARLLTLQKVEALVPALGKFLAVRDVARLDRVGVRTVWNWYAMIEGVRDDDRLPYLAPRNRARAAPPRSKDCEPAFFDVIRSDYLRAEAPPFTDCYRRAARVAKANGWAVLPERTMRRRLDAAVSSVTQTLARKGLDAVKRAYPSQVRDKTALVPMEAVNGDFHKFDVFVRWPAARGEDAQIVRPQMVAFQDVHSGRILAWRMDITPNSTAVMLAAGDMITEWGIPDHVLLDNGREFAAKCITGGAATRYRFKVKEDDIPGLFVALGCKIHWATPYSGQSKPIERAFRDMCQSISKDPRFEGAYTGNRPDAQPENYGNAAIPLEKFLAVVAEGIEEHNTRLNRRSEVAYGRSFAQVFDEGYATAQPRKATEVQRRMWLLGAEGLRAEAQSGRIRFQGSEFWEPWMHEIAGKRVIVRFDPADFWSGLHIYSADNAYLGHAPCLVKGQFFDMDDARAHMRARAAWLKAEKAAAIAQRKYTAADIGIMLDAVAPDETPKPEAKVVRATFGKASGRPAAEPASGAISKDQIATMQAAMVADLDAHRTAPIQTEDTSRQRFRSALEMERKQARGEAITRDQQRWLSMYQQTAEYRSERAVWDDFGDAVFG